MNREKLMAAGISYDEGVDRFAGKPPMFEKYLIKFFDGHLMEELAAQLQAKDVEAAFRTAHDLKGNSGTLSLTAFYKKVCELTELLRHGSADDDYAPVFAQAQQLYDTAKQAVEGELA